MTEEQLTVSDPDELEDSAEDTDTILAEGEIVGVPDVLRVRYTGTSNVRILADDMPAWNGAGAEVPWESWVETYGDEASARAVLRQHLHEFEMAGPGADEFWVEDSELPAEFDLGGVVKE